MAERGQFFRTLLPEERRSRVCARCVAITMPLVRIRWLGLTDQIAMLNPLQ
jgi:hypothetical protein